MFTSAQTYSKFDRGPNNSFLIILLGRELLHFSQYSSNLFLDTSITINSSVTMIGDHHDKENSHDRV
jgi:hypothetical protein